MAKFGPGAENGSSHAHEPKPFRGVHPATRRTSDADADWSDDPVAMPEDVQRKFDAIKPDTVREAFSPRKRIKDVRGYCKDRIRALRYLGFQPDEMVAIARAYPQSFGKLRTQTWPTFAAILGELREGDAENARKARVDDFVCTLADLQTQVFPPIKWIVPDYLPEGLAVFAGKPKIGKSWWMLGVALGVARGTEVLGKFVQQGDVLYCGLEDGKRRMHARVTKVLGHAIKQWPANFTFRERLNALDAGGLDTIEAWLVAHPNRRLVVLDTYGKVRGMKNAREEQYQYDYRLVGSLQELATKYSVAIVLVHHVRKSGDAEDILDTICGSTGIAGAADTPMVLGKTTHGIRFYLRGRDVEEQDKLVEFDPETGLWSVTGDYEEAAAAVPGRRTAWQGR